MIRNLRKKIDELDHFEFLLISVLILFPLAYLSYLVNGYKGYFFSEYLSFVIPDGWCTLPNEGIGSHCFGDFGFPRSAEYNSKLIEEPTMYLANTPLTILFFMIIKKISYNFGLLLYLAVLAISAVAPIWLASKSKNLVIRVGGSVFLGLLSIGSVAALDRGNAVLVMVLLAYLFLVSRNNYTQNLALFLLINLKFWGLVFLIILLSQKRYKDLIIVVSSTIIFNLIFIQLFFGNIFSASKNIFLSVISRDYAESVQQYSISIFGFIRRLNCLLSENQNCYSSTDILPLSALSFLYIFTFVCLITSFLYAKKSELAVTLRYAPTLISTFLLVPEAPIYQISMIIVIVSLLAHDKKKLDPTERYLAWSLVIALIFSTVPFAIHWNPTILLPPQRYFYWLFPMVWGSVIIFFTHTYVTKIRVKNHQVKSPV